MKTKFLFQILLLLLVANTIGAQQRLPQRESSLVRNYGIRPFLPRYVNPSVRGNITYVANNILTSSGVLNNTAPPGPGVNNMGLSNYVDIDDTFTSLFPLGSSWKWFSNGTLPAANWNQTNYNSASWFVGSGKFGYGDPGMNVCLPAGCASPDSCYPTCGTKYTTYYFIKDINIPTLAGFDGFKFSYLRDDGIVIYVNGVEVFRNNMPAGVIDNNTLAASALNGADESTVFEYVKKNLSPFIVGNNVIAVELHQSNASSSDLVFDLGLSLLQNNGTFSRSNATLFLPSPCAKILFAGLYWGTTLGDVADSSWRSSAIDSLKLKLPGASSFINVRSDVTDLHNFGEPNAGQNHVGYAAFADITSVINVNNASGVYEIADIVCPTNRLNAAGGWSIVFAYEDLADPVPKDLVVFDGASFVTNQSFVDIPLAGFQTPVIGPVVADFGVICYDGDRENPDGFFFKQDSAAAGAYIDLSLPANAITAASPNDSWNSTISYLNNIVTTRTPAHINTHGFDSKIIRLNNTANSLLNNNVTSARLRLNSAGEKYYLQVLTSAISVAVPSFIGSLSSLDLNGGANFAPNDSLKYKISWSNRGTDTADNVVIIDSIPFNTVYKANSLAINGVAKTDAPGDDEAEFDPIGNQVIFRVGVGATNTLGGVVLPFPAATDSGNVSFTVTAINICELLQCNASVSNKAKISYVGRVTGSVLSSVLGLGLAGCSVANPKVDTIIGQCASLKDTLFANICSGATVQIPIARYPRYVFYRAMPFVPANIFNPTTAITATGIYYGTVTSPSGCADTVRIRVLITNCNDIDDDDDGIPDYVEMNIPLALADHDADGEANWSDLDFPSRVDLNADVFDDRFDGFADADNDGIPNFYDPDYNMAGAFVDANGDGVNDLLDADLDGIINQADRDSDNDGVPDVVEQFGVDADGDGRIDNYVDTDNDGFSQNVDANATGARGSLNGLTYASIDNDVVPNANDIDADNDGIPDITEVLAIDANHNGKVDGIWIDNDIDGFFDAFDGDADGLLGSENSANALLRTGNDLAPIDGRADNYPNKNFDNDSKPNLFDVDSDSDGMLDRLEAGFPAGANGFVAGLFGVTGWSNVISSSATFSLENTDGRGQPNYLDIDSDDDGIPDNIEAQPTAFPLPASYIMPNGLDDDGDGLENLYDNAPASFSGNGLAPLDIDGDFIPDYKDLDTDSDGQPDVIEGNDFNRNNFYDDDVALTLLDTDGDGLDNKFDSSNTSIKGTSYNLANGGYNNGDNMPGARAPIQRRIITNIDRDWRTAGTILSIVNLKLNYVRNYNQEVYLNLECFSSEIIKSFQLEGSNTFGLFEPIQNLQRMIMLQGATQINFQTSIIATQYRVKAILQDGRVAYSNIVFSTNSINTNFKIVPNPINALSHILVSVSKSQTAVYSVFNMVGQVVFKKEIRLVAGQNKFPISDLMKLPKGKYILDLLTSEKKWSTQLMIMQ